MSWPPPYPRVAHLPPGPGSVRDDLVLSKENARALLSQPVVIEEKLDGANVMLWLEADRVRAATRGGPGAQDRSSQLGPLRAWAARKDAQLRPLLSGGRVLYGEWLWLTHSHPYDALPDHLVGLDLYSREQGFAPLAERDRALISAAVALPPRLFTGVLHGRPHLDELLGLSRYGTYPAEGLVIRLTTGQEGMPRLAKVVSPSFERRGDESWQAQRQRNTVSQ